MKIGVNYFLFWLLLIAFLSLAITGIIKFPGLLQSLKIQARYLPMYEISKIHDWSGVTLSVLILIHIFLHRKWIVSITKKYFKKDNKNNQ